MKEPASVAVFVVVTALALLAGSPLGLPCFFPVLMPPLLVAITIHCADPLVRHAKADCGSFDLGPL